MMNQSSLTGKTKEELALLMEISLRTLQRRLNKAGLKIPRGRIPPDVQIIIFEKLGWSELARSDTK